VVYGLWDGVGVALTESPGGHSRHGEIRVA
jgi:hypothetical protein